MNKDQIAKVGHEVNLAMTPQRVKAEFHKQAELEIYRILNELFVGDEPSSVVYNPTISSDKYTVSRRLGFILSAGLIKPVIDPSVS